MANATEPAQHGFTPEQMDWIERRIEARASRTGGDRGGAISVLKWTIGGLFVLGLATGGYLSTPIQSVESALRGEIAENRAAIAEIANGLARIEAIIEERLPRDR